VPQILPAPYALIVDDEPMVGELVARVLSLAGYRTMVEGDGESGLRALEEADGPVPIAVIDLWMPGLHGIAVAEAIATRFPATGVLLIAGDPQDAGDPAPGVLLAKPFTATELTDAVARQRRTHRRRYMRGATYAGRLAALIDRAGQQARVVASHVAAIDEFLARRRPPPAAERATARG